MSLPVLTSPVLPVMAVLLNWPKGTEERARQPGAAGQRPPALWAPLQPDGVKAFTFYTGARLGSRDCFPVLDGGLGSEKLCVLP